MKLSAIPFLAGLPLFIIFIAAPGCNTARQRNAENAFGTSISDSLSTYGLLVPAEDLPRPYETESAGKSREGKVIGWPHGKTPIAPEGFVVEEYATEFDHPRWIYIAENGDVFIAESNDSNSADRVTILRDTDRDGKPDVRQAFIEDLNQPFGMLILNGHFYVANVDKIVRYPYELGQTRITGNSETILELPAGGYNHHWTRNIIANEDGSRIYVSVGSASNNGEYGMDKEERRANILEINPDGSGERIFASGLRNPIGMDWAPETNVLWTAVNERDKLGDNLVPDYITSVKGGEFYGWPYAYFGPREDPRMIGEAPDLVQKTLVPEVALGAHTSSIGLVFYTADNFPERYHDGAFVAQHGSWNRSVLNGYRVLFVPFEKGEPSGPPEDFLTGFIADLREFEVYGRPTCVALHTDGSLLLSDDDSNTIWRISAE